MPKVKRFAYVSAPSASILHRFYGTKFVEGEPAACGIRVQPGWPFWYGKPRYITRVCKRCELATVTP